MLSPMRVSCALDLGTASISTRTMLILALSGSPTPRYIVVVPTRIAHGAYARAEERGICVGGFGDLLDAHRNDGDLAKHMDIQQQYERRRLTRNAAVRSVKRKGRRAYEIMRKKLRPLTIVTTDDYELTADQVYTLLESYESIPLDVIVVTNPNCRGLSTDSQEAAADAGVGLELLRDFLQKLATNWS
jgi:hypothetical protein